MLPLQKVLAMRRVFTLAFSLLFFAFMCQSAAAQRSRKHTKAKLASAQVNVTPQNLPENTFDEARKLVESYRFSEAEKLLSTLFKRGTSQSELFSRVDSLRSQIEKLRSLLQATQRVMIIDSVLLKRSDVLTAYKMSDDAGKVAPLGQIASNNPFSQADTESCAYLNPLADMLLFSAKTANGNYTLFESARNATTWEEPHHINIIGEADQNQEYPYMLSDGQTLYYASPSSQGMGGLDIYVTRYDRDTQSYLQPQLLGMPFNSPGNDFLYVVDEARGIGFFATDRHHRGTDSVCVYTFIPPQSIETYDAENTDAEKLRQLALLNDIKLTQYDEKAVREKLNELSIVTPSDEDSEHLRFVINDAVVYHSLEQFANPAARRIADEWRKRCGELREVEKKIRQKVCTQGVSARDVAALERRIYDLKKQIATLQKNMSQAELRTIGK